MINARRLAMTISWVALSATLIYAQDVRPSEVRVIARRPAAIQQLELQPQRLLSAWAVLSAPLTDAQDLSTYRGFQFGMSLPAVAKQTGLKASEAKVIHQRPAVIQELKWELQFSPSSSPQADPVRTILFSFYNGELFRMVVGYDRYRTEGLTTEDVVEAISAQYGTATKPGAELTFSSSQIYNDSEAIIARWEDSQYSFNLFRSSYQPIFGMIAFSKQLDTLARAATVEGIRLDEQEAPQREIDRQKKQEGESRAAQEKARLGNKPSFRP